MEQLNGYNPQDEADCFARDIAWALAQQGGELTAERRKQWVRTGFCTQHELNLISRYYKQYKGLGEVATSEDYEGWSGCS